MDDSTSRCYFKIWHRKGLDSLIENRYGGRSLNLTEQQCVELKAHLKEIIYPRAKSIASYGAQTFKVKYTPEGLAYLLHRLRFVYKKTKPVPGKADPEKQKAFLEKYYQLKEQKGPHDRIYFMDGCHPNHKRLSSL